MSQLECAAIVASSYDAIIGKTLGGIITSWNSSAERLYGFSADEAIGQHISLIVPSDKAEELADILARLQQGERIEITETLRKRKDGGLFPVAVTISPIRDANGTLVGASSTAHDITRRKAHDSALQRQIALNRAVLDSLLAHVAVLNRDGMIVATNASWNRFATQNSLDRQSPSPRTGVGSNYLDVCRTSGTAEDAQESLEGILSVMRGEQTSFTLEYPCHSPQERRWFQMSVTPLDPDSSGVVISHLDITARHNAEETLRESETRFRDTFEQAAVGITHVSLKGRCLRVNQRLCDMLGYSRDELLIRTLKDITHPDDLTSSLFDQVEAGELQTFSRNKRYLRKGGSQVWGNLTVSLTRKPDGQPDYFIAVIEDITERKQAELQRNYVLDSARCLLWSCEVHVDDGELIWSHGYFDEEAAQRLIPLETETGTSYTHKWHTLRFGDDGEDDTRNIATFIRAGQNYQIEFALRATDGAIHWLHEDVRVQTIKPGKHWRLVGVCTDISETKRATDTLRAEQERFTVIAATVPGVIYTSRLYPDGTVTLPYVSPTLPEIFDIPVQGLDQDASPMFALIHPDDLLSVQASRTMSALNISERRTEFRVNHPVKGQIWVEARSTPVQEADGSVLWHGFMSDITKRKQAEESILQMNAELEQRVLERTAQLQAINQEMEFFCYSVSHDLRAPLRYINGFSEALLEDYADLLDETGRGFLNRVRRASQEMGHLIEALLELSRISRSEISQEVVNLSAMAEDVITMLRLQDPERMVNVQIMPDMKAVGDRHLLHSVLVNLLGNAWKYTMKSPSVEIAFSSFEQAGEIVYVVRDNGAGFDMAYADKLFRPFQRLHGNADFEGTGIGLATVQRIIARHGGRIWAKGVVNQGAEFYFTLNG